MMRASFMTILVAGFVVWGCGGEAREPTVESGGEPMMAVHGAGEEDPVGMHGSMGINTEVDVPPAIFEAFAGVRLSVVDTESGQAREVEASFGESVDLGETGLTVTPLLFVPDFVMDGSGISTRSADPNNPAAKVRIEAEDGAEPFEGWLFAKLPDVHPFVHQRYRVLLVAGVPVSSDS